MQSQKSYLAWVVENRRDETLRKQYATVTKVGKNVEYPHFGEGYFQQVGLYKKNAFQF